MLTVSLRICLIIGIVIYFVIIFAFLKNKALRLRYTLLWLVAGLCMLILTIWPEILLAICGIIGIYAPVNALYFLLIAFLIMILMSVTSIVSNQAEKIKNLTQTIGRMEKRIRELENED